MNIKVLCEVKSDSIVNQSTFLLSRVKWLTLISLNLILESDIHAYMMMGRILLG